MRKKPLILGTYLTRGGAVALLSRRGRTIMHLGKKKAKIEMRIFEE